MRPARLVWSLTSAALATGTTLSAAGNSGPWSAANPNLKSAVDLRYVDDVWLSVSAAGGAGTSLAVALDGFDDLGNLYAGLLATTAITAAPGSAIVFGGRHGAGGGKYLVLPEWGRVSWAVTGTFTGVEIALYARG